MLNIQQLSFTNLKSTQLYDILQLRAAVFVVEQDCVYQDLDGKDGQAYHILGSKGDTLVAYTRIFAPGDYFKEAAIGRVAVHKEHRKQGHGLQIMRSSIAFLETRYPSSAIKLSAQLYLDDFYTSLGFKAFGESYLEDGIPHIAMLRPPK